MNYNCPGQVTVAGLAGDMPAFGAAVKAAGGRALPLKVSGGFHSPFMTEAAELFRRRLAEVTFAAPQIPLYSNVTAKRYGDEVADLLAAQIESPVRWEALIRNMIADGVDTFVEIGPGRTLCGLIRKIDSGVRVYTWKEMWNEVAGC